MACAVYASRVHIWKRRAALRMPCMHLYRASLVLTRASTQDSGKLVHVGAAGLAGSSNSLADYNRAGTPLVEIVSEPDLRSGREAAAYGAEIQRLVRLVLCRVMFWNLLSGPLVPQVRFLGVGDGNMSEGSLRCDVNVSVRRKGDTQLGTKV